MQQTRIRSNDTCFSMQPHILDYRSSAVWAQFIQSSTNNGKTKPNKKFCMKFSFANTICASVEHNMNGGNKKYQCEEKFSRFQPVFYLFKKIHRADKNELISVNIFLISVYSVLLKLIFIHQKLVQK